MDPNADIGDAETFVDILGLLGEYEGVLNRHESLAASLGAKLTGPRLLRAMEGVFDGPIITKPPQTPFTTNAVSWLDILQFSKTNPNEFILTPTLEGNRICQFFLKGVQVEITEDDWRIIMSGGLESFRIGATNQPLEEDEATELATLEIVEGRLQTLIKKADEVAKKARQLNYQLSGRKAAIHSRRNQPANQQPGRGVGNASNYDLHADLLQQFTSHTHLTRSRASSAAAAAALASSPYSGPAPKPHAQQRIVPSGNRPSAASSTSIPPESQLDGTPQQSAADDPATRNRLLITACIERLEKGKMIYPPCDRCRRLKTNCVKHLTACQGCTKKHAKCSWKTATDDEVARLRQEMRAAGGSEPPELMLTADNDEGGSGSRSVPEAREEAQTDAGESRRSSSGDWRARSNVGSGFEGESGGSQRRPEAQMDVDQPREPERENRTDDSKFMIGGHSLLSHMASVASARAEARDARDGVDTSSTSSNTPRR